MPIASIIKFSAIGLAVLLGVAVWMAMPYYGFHAHRGDASFGPLGWTDIPVEDAVPSTQDVFDTALMAEGDEALRRLMEYRSSIGTPAMSAAVSIQGEMVWRGSVGWADLEARTPATSETMFRIGSTSKAVTATALARLVDRGLIDLDAPISDYLDDLPNPSWEALTTRQLASHTAGLPHYGQNQDPSGRNQSMTLNTRFDSPFDALSQFDESELLFEPATNFHYSSFGTVLLGAVMSAATGLPYEDVIQSEVLDPVGMASTFADPGLRPDRHHAPFNQMARYYYLEDDRVRRWRNVDLSGRLPGGGWLSTPTDLVRMGQSVMDDSYLSGDTRDTFWTPQILADGNVNEQNYALGWRWREWDVEGFGLARNANHGGVSRGSQSWLLVFPDLDMVMAFTINGRTEEFADFGMFYADLVQVFGPVAQARQAPAG